LRVRIYYNSHGAAPRIWSYDYGTQQTEVAVTGFRLFGVTASGGRDQDVPIGDLKRPRVWIEINEASEVQVAQDGAVEVYGRKPAEG
jgi:hypothetical protein